MPGQIRCLNHSGPVTTSWSCQPTRPPLSLSPLWVKWCKLPAWYNTRLDKKLFFKRIVHEVLAKCELLHSPLRWWHQVEGYYHVLFRWHGWHSSCLLDALHPVFFDNNNLIYVVVATKIITIHHLECTELQQLIMLKILSKATINLVENVKGNN